MSTNKLQTFTSGVFPHLSYVGEQKVNISSACVALTLCQDNNIETLLYNDRSNNLYQVLVCEDLLPALLLCSQLLTQSLLLCTQLRDLLLETETEECFSELWFHLVRQTFQIEKHQQVNS